MGMGGNIINISSEAGVRSLAVMIHYSMTKAAQLNISRGLAELTKGTQNVRVNALLPGPTWTPGVKQYMEGFAKEKGYGMILMLLSKHILKNMNQTHLSRNLWIHWKLQKHACI